MRNSLRRRPDTSEERWKEYRLEEMGSEMLVKALELLAPKTC